MSDSILTIACMSHIGERIIKCIEHSKNDTTSSLIKCQPHPSDVTGSCLIEQGTKWADEEGGVST